MFPGDASIVALVSDEGGVNSIPQVQPDDVMGVTSLILAHAAHV